MSTFFALYDEKIFSQSEYLLNLNCPTFRIFAAYKIINDEYYLQKSKKDK